jgi:DNA repair protein SbcC/Rad50
MIPVKLVLKGLYSYQAEQVIDFENLINAHLFGIFGSVGSGKSTILEAISYALYGETERLNRQDDRSYNMMNLKSNELWIDFIFRLASGKQFRFTVSGKRHKQQFEKISAFNRNAYELKNGEWIPLESADAEQLLGLSYKNFRRTVIIPQGKFEEFLQLKPKDRTTMLKELFGLERYELLPQVSRLGKKNDEQRTHLKGQLSQIKEADAQEIAKEEKEVEVLLKRIKSHEKRARAVQTELLGYRELQDLFRRLKEAKDRKTQLEEQEKKFSELEKKIQDVQTCRLQFVDLIERIHETDKQHSDLLKQIDQREYEIKKMLKSRDKAQTDLQRARENFEKRDETREKTRDLQTILELLLLKEKAQNLQNTVNEQSQKAEKASALYQSMLLQEKQTYQNLITLRQTLPDVAILLDLKQWHQRQTELLKQKEQTKDEHQNQNKEIDELIQQSQDLVPEHAGLLPDFNALLTVLAKDRERLQTERNNLQEQIQHKWVFAKLGEFAKELEPGSPCPLCGSLEHTQKFDGAEHEQKVQELQQRLDQLDYSLAHIDKQIATLKQNQTSYQHYKNVRDNLGEKIEQLQKDLGDHNNAYKGSKDQKDLNKIDSELAQAQKTNEKISSLEKNYTLTRNQTEKAQKETESAKQQFDQATKSLDQNQVQQETLLTQLLHLEFQQYENKSLEWLRSAIDRGNELVLKMQSDLEHAEKQFQSIQSSVQKMTADQQADKKVLQQLLDKTASLNKTLQSRLDDSPYESIDQIKDILATELHIKESEQELKSFQHALFAARQAFSELTEACKDKEYDPELHKEREKQLEDLRKKSDDWREQAGAQKSRIEQMHRALEQRKKLEKELSKLDHRHENINTLRQLFKGSGFVNYISSVYLQNLCQGANHRFHRLTRQNLSLVLGTDNSFQIRDYLNEGKLRSIKTLSGGQMFQAALSLALALAENLQQYNQSKQNFFFLDEGFGSQDKESLQTVFDTLQTLQKDNRIIGIISHVEELQQEFDVYLRIVNDEETGSQVKPSWELI